MRWTAVLLGVALLSACGGSGATTDAPAGPVPATTSTTMAVASHAPTPKPTTHPEEQTMITMTVEGREIPVTLDDSPTARDLASRAPVTLTFTDYGGQEKTARLERPLTMDGAPEGDSPKTNEIGWYAPNGVVVLWYSEIGYWPGIVRLGSVSSADMAWLRTRPDGFTAELTAS